MGKSDCGKALHVPVLEADAMFTDQVEICLAVTLADCIGIAIYDIKNGITGICHSGWKGCLKNICGKLVDNMVKSCGCKSENLLVSISPSICYKCFYVSCELVEGFSEKYKDFICEKKDKFYIDLKGIVRFQLIEKGIPERNIFDCKICTYENTHIFYSHKAEKDTGRFIFAVYKSRQEG